MTGFTEVTKMSVPFNRTLFRICVLAAASMALASAVLAQNDEAEARRIAAYPLTMDLFNRYAAAALEVARLSKNDPAYSQMRNLQDLSLDARIQRFETTPHVVAILKAHGISARDMVMTSAAVSAVMIVKAAMQTGAGQNEANKLEWKASVPEHVKFYDAHQAEMKKYQDNLMLVVRQR